MRKKNRVLITGLYIVSTPEKWPCKIGITKDLKSRVSDMQVGAWGEVLAYEFYLVHIGSSKDGFYHATNSAVMLERDCHAKLKELDLHIRGEWFNIDVESARLVVQKVAGMGGYKLATSGTVANHISNMVIQPGEFEFYEGVLAKAIDNQQVIDRGKDVDAEKLV